MLELRDIAVESTSYEKMKRIAQRNSKTSVSLHIMRHLTPISTFKIFCHFTWSIQTSLPDLLYDY